MEREKEKEIEGTDRILNTSVGIKAMPAVEIIFGSENIIASPETFFKSHPANRSELINHALACVPDSHGIVYCVGMTSEMSICVLPDDVRKWVWPPRPRHNAGLCKREAKSQSLFISVLPVARRRMKHIRRNAQQKQDIE